MLRIRKKAALLRIREKRIAEDQGKSFDVVFDISIYLVMAFVWSLHCIRSSTCWPFH